VPVDVTATDTADAKDGYRRRNVYNLTFVFRLFSVQERPGGRTAAAFTNVEGLAGTGDADGF